MARYYEAKSKTGKGSSVDMMGKDRCSKDVDAIVAKLKSPQKETVQALRELVLETGSDLKEQVKWRNPTYTRKDNVCWIILYKDHADFGFFKGTSLSDPHKVLEGTGKRLRHVKIRAVEEIKPEVLRPLIREALALDGK